MLQTHLHYSTSPLHKTKHQVKWHGPNELLPAVLAVTACATAATHMPWPNCISKPAAIALWLWSQTHAMHVPRASLRCCSPLENVAKQFVQSLT